MSRTYLRITEVQTQEGRDDAPKPIVAKGGKRAPILFAVWVGNDEDGWVQVPGVTRVNIPLRAGKISTATITVIRPQIDLEGGPN